MPKHGPCFLENSLLAHPLPLKLPNNECVYCPGVAAHVGGVYSNLHKTTESAYLRDLEKWMQSASEATLLEPAYFDGDVPDNYKHGLRMISSSADDGVNSALMGISLTSFFDEAHIAETIIFLAQRYHFIRFVVIVDPYVCSQTCKVLQKAGSWNVGMSTEDACKSINAVKMREAAQKIIIQKFRMVRRAVKIVFGEDLHIQGSDVPHIREDGPAARFTWIQWSEVAALPLYTQLRTAISNAFESNTSFRAAVLSVAHHPVIEPTSAEAAAEALIDASLTSEEIKLFSEYFLSEHAFLAALPTWLKCAGSNIFLPYHCESRALPFIMSLEHFNPIALGLVEPEYSHANIGLAVLPSASSNSRSVNPIEKGNYHFNLVSPISEMPHTPLDELLPVVQINITEANISIEDGFKNKELTAKLESLHA